MMQTGTDKKMVQYQAILRLWADFTKQYNRQKTIIQSSELGLPSSQVPKRNPQANVSAGVAPPAYTSRKTDEYDDTFDSLSRFAGRIKLRDDSK